MAAELSQVGKLFVPRELLTKTGKLSEEEQAEMARVPEHAYRVLRDIDFELPVPAAVHEMYERMDGTGYPRHLVGEAISVHARVLAVVNAFCAMVGPRSYRAGMSDDEALRILRGDPSFDRTGGQSGGGPGRFRRRNDTGTIRAALPRLPRSVERAVRLCLKGASPRA